MDALVGQVTDPDDYDQSEQPNERHEAVEDEEDDGGSDQEEEDEDEEEEEVEEEEVEPVEFKYKGKTYYALNLQDSVIYDLDENGDISVEVGKFVKGKPVFNKR